MLAGWVFKGEVLGKRDLSPNTGGGKKERGGRGGNRREGGRGGNRREGGRGGNRRGGNNRRNKE